MRPAQLESRDWLTRRYAQLGDRAIAKELGCAPSTVTVARRRLGVMPAREGRRPGRPHIDAAAAPEVLDEPVEEINLSSVPALVERFNSEQDLPATDELLLGRVRAWLKAELCRDELAAEDALLSIASAALLLHQPSQLART